MCYSHLDHSPVMKLHETEARARELAAGLAEDRKTASWAGLALVRGLRKLTGKINWIPLDALSGKMRLEQAD